ncbi:hypothetical protein, partial [Persicitalea sp.]|uniref:hypothetical protein n=1 Tax=Persicitalea sp. TaxID=3100273 RepID=UPI00359421EF
MTNALPLAARPNGSHTFFFACLLCALALLLAAPGFAATIYVDASVAPGGTGNGSSWANAHQSLQTA